MSPKIVAATFENENESEEVSGERAWRKYGYSKFSREYSVVHKSIKFDSKNNQKDILLRFIHS